MLYRNPGSDPQLATLPRKNSLLPGRNLRQDQAHTDGPPCRWMMDFSSCNLASKGFEVVGLILCSWSLSQKLGSCFRDDVPGLQNILFGREPGRDDKAHNEVAVNFSRADLHSASLVHSPEQLPGQIVSFLKDNGLHVYSLYHSRTFPKMFNPHQK